MSSEANEDLAWLWAATPTPLVGFSPLAVWERDAILRTLIFTQGSTLRAAEILGISQRTVQMRLKKWREDAQQRQCPKCLEWMAGDSHRHRPWCHKVAD